MEKIKKSFSIILVLLIACLSLGTIASAANSTATEVQISIEAAEEMLAGGGDNNGRMGRANSVQTGDKKNICWLQEPL